MAESMWLFWQKNRKDDLTVILPFYKKLSVFKEVLHLNAPYFARAGIEVIIVMDEPSEEAELIAFLKSYPQIQWRLIVNDKPHPWRNPAKTINVGIRHARKSKILVMSPESRMLTDVIKILSKKADERRRIFTTGLVQIEHTSRGWLPYGSICAPRAAFELIRGYDEAYTEWGADDDDVRMRLTYAGYRELRLLRARLLHTEAKPRPIKQLSESSRHILEANQEQKRVVTNSDDWGRDFSRIAYES